MGAVKKERICGLDVIRTASMLFVVAVHVLGIGGGIANTQNMLLKVLFCLLQAVSLCCINLFAMSSGFLHYGRKPHLSGLLGLLFQSFFWLVIVTVIYAAVKGDMTVIKDNFENCLHIVTKRVYWYLSDYFVLFFLMPFLNAAVRRLEPKYLTLSIILLLFITSFIPSVFPYIDLVSKGYSVTWLAVMYILGAYIKKYDLIHRANTKVCFLIFEIFILLEAVYSFLSYMMGNALGDFYYKFSAYNCVFVVGASIMLFLLLAKVDFKSEKIKNALSVMSASAFTVYLVHCAPLIYDNYIEGKMTFVRDFGALKTLGAILGIIISIYAAGMILGVVQNKLFKLIRIPNFFRLVENKINICYDSLYERYIGKITDNNA